MKTGDMNEATENKVVDLTEFKSKKDYEDLKQRGPLTQDIFCNAEYLESLGWSVTFYVREIEERTAYADYDNKKLIVNEPSAFYASHLMSRIHLSVEPNEYNNSATGVYKYSFVDGEKIYNDDGTYYHFQYLTVEEVNEFPDIKTETLL